MFCATMCSENIVLSPFILKDNHSGNIVGILNE